MRNQIPETKWPCSKPDSWHRKVAAFFFEHWEVAVPAVMAAQEMRAGDAERVLVYLRARFAQEYDQPSPTARKVRRLRRPGRRFPR